MKKLLSMFDNVVDVQTATQHTSRITVAGVEVLYASIEAKDRDEDGDLDVIGILKVGGKVLLSGELDLGDIDYSDFEAVMDAAAELIEEQFGVDVPGLGK